MNKIYLYHFGLGNVGKEFLKILDDNKQSIRDKFGVEVVYCAGFASSGGVFSSKGLPNQIVSTLIKIKSSQVLAHSFKEQFIKNPDPLSRYLSSRSVVIDTTNSDNMGSLLLRLLKKGCFAILSNKKPLTGNFAEWNKLQQTDRNRIYFETTVGAGLPVINTLQSLLDTGDEIIEIKGCLSGTLGFIFSQLEEGASFSQTLCDAKEKGYTEPDPRDDLSGTDIARKALILARMLGQRNEFSEIQLESLYLEDMDNLSISEFMANSEKIDGEYLLKTRRAQQKNCTLRYVATITPHKCSVGVEEVAKESALGSLKGPDNLIMFKTKRYNKNALVIKGPGAGIEVTAAGVLADLISIIHRVS